MADPHILIDDLSTEISFTVGASARDEFPFAFQFFANSNLIVTVDDAVQTLTTDYTVAGTTGFTGGFDGGTVTLDTAVTNAVVVIRRVLPYERQTDFPLSGPLDITALNTELDKGVARDQQLRDGIADAEQSVQDALDTFESVNGATTEVHDFATRTALIAATVGVSVTYARTAGRAAVGDGGHALYKSSLTVADDLTQSADGKHWVRVEPDFVDARACGVKANNVDDDTDALRRFIAACAGKRGLLPNGYMPVTSSPGTPALTLDPAVAMIIQGTGRETGNGESGSVIHNTGTGHCVFADGYLTAVADRQIQFRDFTVRGNNSSLNGFHLRQITAGQFDNVASRHNGGSGIYAGFCFGLKITKPWITGNRQYGIQLDSENNYVAVENGLVAANDAALGGYANVHIAAALTGGENNSIRLTSLDLSGYSGTEFGVIASKVCGLVIEACDIEGCTTEGIYALSDASGLIIGANHFAGSSCFLENAKNSIIMPNTFRGAAGILHVVTSAAGDNVGVAGQQLLAGATENLSGAGVYKFGRAP